MHFYFLDRELKQLRRDLKATRQAAFAVGTHKNHLTHWRTYFFFCLYFSLDPLPASVDTVCLYCQFLSRSLTPDSVRNYLSGAKFLHIALGHDFPSLKEFAIRVTLRGIDRLALHCPVRAPPVTPCILFLLVQNSCSPDSSLEEITFSCAFLFAFFLLARISNIVPASVRSFDPRKHLCRGDIVPAPHGLTVTFKWSKTNQTGSRHLQLPLVAIPNSPSCPVLMFHRICTLVPACSAAPAFVLPSLDGSLSPITKSVFVRVFRRRLSLAGVFRAHSFRGHSFRRGGANWAFQCGLPGELIQVFGDWSSEAYKSYLDFALPAKLRVAQVVSKALIPTC